MPVTAPTAPPAGTPAGNPTRTELALLRLQASRERLACAWLPDLPEGREGRGGAHAPRLAAWWRLARRRLAGTPVVGQALDALSHAWQRHPMRPGVELMASEVSVTLSPFVRRHPLASVAAAAGVSAALVALRPWRWAWVAAAWRPWPARCRRWAWWQLSRLPLQSLLAGWLLSDATVSASSDTPRRPAPMAPAQSGT